jgi:hypothetical protein
MNRLAIAIVLSSFALGAYAQSPTPAASTQVQVQGEVTVVTGDQDQNKLEDQKCLRETGSHIKKKNKKECNNAIGRSYTRADLDRTGTMDLGDALRHLDPSIKIGHN